MVERTVVIVNPNSKGGQTGKNWDSNNILEKYFGNDYEIIFTEKSGDGTNLAAKYFDLKDMENENLNLVLQLSKSLSQNYLSINNDTT